MKFGRYANGIPLVARNAWRMVEIFTGEGPDPGDAAARAGVIVVLSGLPVPPIPVPPADPSPVEPGPYTGRYAVATGKLEVAGADGGLSVAAEREQMRFVHLDGHTFIADKPVSGVHPVIRFLMDGGRAACLFHGGRAIPRA